jgi:pilus assembly protein Flp/PilA
MAICAAGESMPKILKRVRADNSGATAIEYGLVAAFVALAVVAGLSAIKGSLADVFREVDAGLTATSAAGGSGSGGSAGSSSATGSSSSSAGN